MLSLDGEYATREDRKSRQNWREIWDAEGLLSMLTATARFCDCLQVQEVTR